MREHTLENPCTNEPQWSLFGRSGQRLTSNIFDVEGREIELGDRIELTFYKDSKIKRHTAVYEVIWNDAAYKIKSEDTGFESFLGAISSSVQIEVIGSIHTQEATDE